MSLNLARVYTPVNTLSVLIFTAGLLLGAAAAWAAVTVLSELDQIRLGEEPYL